MIMFKPLYLKHFKSDFILILVKFFIDAEYNYRKIRLFLRRCFQIVWLVFSDWNIIVTNLLYCSGTQVSEKKKKDGEKKSSSFGLTRKEMGKILNIRKFKLILIVLKIWIAFMIIKNCHVFIFVYLAADCEERFPRGVHKDDFALIPGDIVINPKN